MSRPREGLISTEHQAGFTHGASDSVCWMPTQLLPPWTGSGDGNSGGPEGEDMPQHSYTRPTVGLLSVDGDFRWIRESVDVRGNVIASVLFLRFPPFTALCKVLGLNRFPAVFYGTLSPGSCRYPLPSLYRRFL